MLTRDVHVYVFDTMADCADEAACKECSLRQADPRAPSTPSTHAVSSLVTSRRPSLATRQWLRVSLASWITVAATAAGNLLSCPDE
jgi:hypothetical protein